MKLAAHGRADAGGFTMAKRNGKPRPRSRARRERRSSPDAFRGGAATFPEAVIWRTAEFA